MSSDFTGIIAGNGAIQRPLQYCSVHLISEKKSQAVGVRVSVHLVHSRGRYSSTIWLLQGPGLHSSLLWSMHEHTNVVDVHNKTPTYLGLAHRKPRDLSKVTMLLTDLTQQFPISNTKYTTGKSEMNREPTCSNAADDVGSM